LQTQYATLGKPTQDVQLVASTRIARHKFDLDMVYLVLRLYFTANCSFRGVKKVLMCYYLQTNFCPIALPCKSTIRNWVQKIGYEDYMSCKKDLYAKDYALIIDESMVIGQQRLMMVLGLPAVKTGDEATNLQTVHLLHLAVRATWTAADVTSLIADVVEKMGKKPLYVISDAGSTLTKGIRDSSLVRICDIGHQIARLIEQTYKMQGEFQEFSKACSLVKFQQIMKESAYLLPPKQRTIARFMNLSNTVSWATKMLAVLPTLTPNEQHTFGFLQNHTRIIQTLQVVFEMTHKILKNIKNKGLSHNNIDECMLLMKPYIHLVDAKLIADIHQYLQTERAKVGAHTVWNASSDVIESLFGKYKQRCATNKLHGVTDLVLSLGLYGVFQVPNDQLKQQVKQALQDVYMTDLHKWKIQYLVENQVVRRTKILKK
jgi:transposase-like protein